MKQFHTGADGRTYHDPDRGIWIPDDLDNRDRAEMQRLVDAGEAEILPYVSSEPPPTYREKRAAAYIQALSDGNPVFAEAIGDLLDAMQKEIRSLRVAAGGTPDADFVDKAAKIDQVKADNPAP